MKDIMKYIFLMFIISSLSVMGIVAVVSLVAGCIYGAGKHYEREQNLRNGRHTTVAKKRSDSLSARRMY